MSEADILKAVRKLDGRLSKTEKKLEGIIELKGVINELKGDMNNRFDEERRDTKEMMEKIERRTKDEINQQGLLLKHVKSRLEELNWAHQERPFTHETVIPRSISTYDVREIRSRPWSPPRHWGNGS